MARPSPESGGSAWRSSNEPIPHLSPEPDVLGQLPPFVKPLPLKIEPEDVKYLRVKGL